MIHSHRALSLFLSLCLVCTISSFAPNVMISSRVTSISSSGGSSSSTSLGMGKKVRNKQAELLKKMSLAKQQNQQDGSSSDDNKKLSADEIKEMNDRRRFDELLKTSVVSMNDIGSDGYLTKEQEEAEIDAYRKGVERLFEGDPAPTQPFQDLVNIKSENALGETGSKRAIPWFRNSNPSDYLIIICDPRVKSSELRETAQAINNQLPKDIASRAIIINADTPAENRRWLKKAGLENLSVYSDEKHEWMRAYTALGENRWSMSMFIIADEKVQKIAREMESITAVNSIKNAVKAMNLRRL